MNGFVLHWTDLIIFIIIGMIVPIRSIRSNPSILEEIDFNATTKKWLYWTNGIALWFLAGVLVVVQLLIGRDMEDLGLQLPIPPLTTPTLLAMATLVLLFLADFLYDVLVKSKSAEYKEEMSKSLGFLPTTSQEYLHYMFLALSAGVCEEIIFRGYLMNYLFAVFQPLPYPILFSIVVQAMIFAIVHQYQGGFAVIKIGLLAIFFGLIFWLNGSIWWLIFIHFLIDLIGGTISFFLPPQEKPSHDNPEDANQA